METVESLPPSLPSSSKPAVVQITSTDNAGTDLSAHIASSPGSASSPSSPQTPSGTTHTFYKPRATSTASARRSRAESLTSSLNNTSSNASNMGGNYPPSSRPQSFSRSRPPSFVMPSVSQSASQTHTGGILPPASFFHPKSPPPAIPSNDIRAPPLNANNVYAPARHSAYSASGRQGGRPSSGISSASSKGGNIPLVSSTSSHAREHGLIMLPLSHIHSGHSDGSNSGVDLSSYSDSSARRRLSGHGPTTRVKPSREALLPIGEKDVSNNSSGKISPHTGVRGSLERIFRRTTSSERERSDTELKKDPARPIMDDHARAASSLSARLRSGSQPPEPVKQPAIPEASSPTVVRKSINIAPGTEVSHTHTMSQAHAFEGVALEGQRFTYGPERNWRQHPSRNTFFLNGRLLTGGDSPLAFLFSVSVLFAIAGTWFGTTCVWWWRHESPAVAAVGIYMCFLTITSMMATALRDPGILPRELDIDPPYPSTPPADGGPRVPLPRDLRVRAGVVRVKYCTTCRIYRPPRSSHCKLCDNCVEGCDHHCPWVNNCIGRRNYTSFFTFLFVANLTLLLVIVTSALHISLLIRRQFVPNFPQALKAAPGSAAAFIMSILVLGPVAALFSYHVRLMLLNITTIEQVRNQAHRSILPGPLPANPFTLKRWYRNLGYLMCRPVNYSYIEASSLVKHDLRLPNPGHDRTARLTSEGFESETFDHQTLDPNHPLHRDPAVWKGDTSVELEMQDIGAGVMGISKGKFGDDPNATMVNRSAWDRD